MFSIQELCPARGRSYVGFYVVRFPAIEPRNGPRLQRPRVADNLWTDFVSVDNPVIFHILLILVVVVATTMIINQYYYGWWPGLTVGPPRLRGSSRDSSASLLLLHTVPVVDMIIWDKHNSRWFKTSDNEDNYVIAKDLVHVCPKQPSQLKKWRICLPKGL